MKSKDKEKRRFTSTARALRVVSDLIKGNTHDRQSVTRQAEVKAAGADRILKAVQLHVDGVEAFRDGRTRKFRLAPVLLRGKPTYTEAVAACLGTSLATLFEGTNHADGMRRAFAHVVKSSSREAAFRDIDRKFWFVRRGGEIALSGKGALFDDLLEAVIRQHRSKMTYQHRGRERVEVKLEPLSIAIFDHQLYVIGRRSDGSVYPYRFSRIDSFEYEEDTEFAYPGKPSYDPERIFEHCLGVHISDEFPVEEIEIKLWEPWGTYALSHRWHASQQTVRLKDHVRLHLTVRRSPELRALILGFGQAAEVISPVSLRNEIRADLTAANARYVR